MCHPVQGWMNVLKMLQACFRKRMSVSRTPPKHRPRPPLQQGEEEVLRHQAEQVAALPAALSSPTTPLWCSTQSGTSSGTNCIEIGLSGKSIPEDYFQENMTAQRPFLLLRISFPGRPIFYNSSLGLQLCLYHVVEVDPHHLLNLTGDPLFSMTKFCSVNHRVCGPLGVLQYQDSVLVNHIQVVSGH